MSRRKVAIGAAGLARSPAHEIQMSGVDFPSFLLSQRIQMEFVAGDFYRLSTSSPSSAVWRYTPAIIHSQIKNINLLCSGFRLFKLFNIPLNISDMNNLFFHLFIFHFFFQYASIGNSRRFKVFKRNQMNEMVINLQSSRRETPLEIIQLW